MSVPTELTKAEQETILLTSEADDTYNIYTFNRSLKRRLLEFSQKHPDLCRLMRQGEILGLTWDCVDFKHNQITVKKQIQQSKKKGSPYYFAPLKNDKTRVLTVAPTVMAYLRERRTEQTAQRLSAGPLWDKTGQVYTNKDCVRFCSNCDLVFTNGLGRHLAINTVYKHFKRVVTSIGLDETRFHDLLHARRLRPCFR